MDKVFLDTNIWLDYFGARSPFDLDAQNIIQQAENGTIEIFISSLSICNISYIIKKISPNVNANQVITDIINLATITKIDENIISNALASNFKDFEDAVQYYSALLHGEITHIITRNIADFNESKIPVLSPSDYLLAR